MMQNRQAVGILRINLVDKLAISSEHNVGRWIGGTSFTQRIPRLEPFEVNTALRKHRFPE